MHPEVQRLVKRRATIKAKITKQFTLLNNDSNPENVSNCKQIIESLLGNVQKLDSEICDILAEDCTDDFIPDEVSSELDKQSTYLTTIKNKLSSFVAPKPVSADPISTSSDCKLKLPELRCESFSGEGTSHLEYHSFITQYNNLIGFRKNITDSVKFTYLKTYLKGYANKLVQHLQVNETNYKVALDLLNSEFLNVEALVDDLLKKLLQLKPEFDPSYLKTKIFLGEMRCLVSDLGIYGYDFINEKAGGKMLSHFVFHRLPTLFQQELVRKLNNNYPSFQDILDNYVDVIKTINLKPMKPATNSFTDDSKKFTVARPTFVRDTPIGETSRKHLKHCKFCASQSHNMVSCQKYASLDARKRRCVELKLCSLCSSQRHVDKDCDKELDYPCFKCKSKKHIAALCDKSQSALVNNYCVNTSDSGRTFLLPIVNIEVGAGKAKTRVKCLLDTGSQRSYLATSVMNRLKCKLENKTSITVNTFIDSDAKYFYETSVSVNLDDRKFVLPFLINDSFDLKINIDGLAQAHSNVSQKYLLQDRLVSDDVVMEGLLGVDTLQCLGQLDLVDCLGGSAFKLPSGIVPFGNIDGFLTREQLCSKYSEVKESACTESSNNSVINYVLNPVPTSFDPVGSVARDSLVDAQLDKMFSLESIGLSNDGSDYDLLKINEFESSIELKDGHYHVDLPWTSKIDDVPSNFQPACAILHRVVDKLRSDGMYDDYASVIDKQLHDGILEKIPASEVVESDHKFIPHRPVIKNDSLTTKLRIVLNCSMKIGNAPSINEAAYPGVDLVNNLFQLLLKTRADNFLVLSDIRSAFLMIKLKTVSDKNKFTIVWKDKNDKLVFYRYTSIVFGYISSPFILQCVMQHHLTKFPNDECFSVIKQGMYVDNLFYTGNDETHLLSLYKEATARMMEGGFDLRCWSSNCPRLNGVFAEDGKASPADTSPQVDKLLGYRYFPAKDQISVTNFDTNDKDNVTKRTILSYISKIFDPLGLVLPVIVKAKVLMRELWQLKLNWDEPVPNDLLITWRKIKLDLDQLPNLMFDRCSYREKVELLIFCDSSKLHYGFTVYAKDAQSGACNLLFGKSKQAPTKAKSLPTLELLSVYLATQCLPSILDSLGDRVLNITICGDSQVVLSWILSGKTKSKNIFAMNRVKDITKSRADIKDKYKLDCKFRYIPTEFNPADLLTRGISYADFASKLDFWLHGPQFLNSPTPTWPQRNLGCLSGEDKLCTMATLSTVSEPLMPVDRFSDVNKLFRVTGLVFEFISKLRKKNLSRLDSVNKAKLYWLKHEQSVHLKEEISFLNDPAKSKVPNLVNNLNLFLDSDGLVRAHGRLDRCKQINYNAKNPILLPKTSFLTSLYIADFHAQCKHLGLATTLTKLRTMGFWVPRGRQVVKSVISKCVLCRKINSFAFKYPVTTDYTKNRVNFESAYQHTGMDYTGNIYVKLGDKLVKMYLLLFTCLNVRAIHLELLPDLTSDQFLLSFVRFSNRYGLPRTVYSDNASTFLQSMGIVAGSSSDNPFNNYLVANNVRHLTIPLYSAWIGAAWERMIKTVKASLHKIVGRKHMKYFELITLLSDIQEAINCRPLTYSESDINFVCITPNSFLKFSPGSTLLLDGEAGTELPVPSREKLVQSLQARDDLLDQIKQRWIDEYLLSLREAGRKLYQVDWHNVVKVGDVVLISSPNKARTHWQLGKITELLPGSDDIVRTVRLMRPDRSEGVYPINLLYPLELQVDQDLQGGSEAPEPRCVQIERPKRAAAQRCRDRIKNICN